MNQPFRYTLEPYKSPKSRSRCPQCRHHNNTFSRYIDTQTGEYLGDKVGRCSRENNCGYHFTPGQYFKEGGKDHSPANNKPWTMDQRPWTNSHRLWTIPDYLPAQAANGSFTNYTKNNFVQYLCKLFGDKIAYELTDRYYIGTSDHWPGATVFWQIDKQGNVRTGKIMLYGADSGKRVKTPFNHITWAHKVVGSLQLADSSNEELAVGNGQFPVGCVQTKTANSPTANCPLPTANGSPPAANYNLDQCLFGEHLLDESRPYYDKTGKPIALVESEKTAIIASVHLPQYIWLATGSMHNLNAAKCQVLKGHKVMLFPDVNAYKIWQRKADDLELLLPNTRFGVSDFLELNANEQERFESWDIGDYLVG
ncbi:MAG: DUF6371 domain-containing protein [Sphingobacteriales bacterium]